MKLVVQQTEAAYWIRDNMSKPVVSFIAVLLSSRKNGDAGAIISGGDTTAEAKYRILECRCNNCSLAS